MDPEILLVGIAAGALVVSQVIRLRRTEALHRSLQEAIRSGSPELVDRLCRLVSAEREAMPLGGLLVGLAAAMILFALIQGGANVRNLVALAMFPGVIGLVVIATGLRKRTNLPDPGN